MMRWMKQMCLFYKIVLKKTPDYLSSLVAHIHSPRNMSKLLKVHPVRTERYKRSFFPCCNFSWNNILKPNDRLSCSLLAFKSKIKTYCKIPTKINNFNSFFTQEIKYINQLRVGLSALNEHKFNHSFAGISPLCICGQTENTLHFFRHCPLFVQFKAILYRDILNYTNINLLSVPPDDFVKLLLYGDPSLGDEVNDKILKSTIKYIANTERLNRL